MRSASPPKPAADALEDWRAFLLRKIKHRQARRAISLRALALRAGFRSPGYLQRLLSGERTPSEEAAGALAQALSLDETDTEHFHDLLALARVTDAAERRRLEARVRARSLENVRTELGPSQASLFRTWFTPIVWALATVKPRSELADWLARVLHPLVNAVQVRRTLETLVEQGFLLNGPDGKLRNDDTVLSITTPASESVLTRYYLGCLSAFGKLATRLPRERRTMRVVTLSFPAELVPELQERVRVFHRELTAWAAAHEPDPEKTERVAAAQISSTVLLILPDEQA